MAIARGAGTEIIRSAYFEDIDSTSQVLIQGVQHHIYTVLSMTIFAVSLQAVTNAFFVKLVGYDSKEGTTAQEMLILKTVIAADSTFVWNDKFSFNGYEPTNFTGPLDDATKQDAIADQGSSVAQYLRCYTSHASDNFEVGITYIDQNNS